MRGWWAGAFVSAIVIGLSVSGGSWAFTKGVETGRDLARQEYESRGYGIRVSVTISGREYVGWVK